MTARQNTITVHATYQPTPLAAFDWCAVLDGREEDGCYAYGATPEEATAALIETLGLDDEDAPAAGCMEDATCAACASGHHDTPGEHADCGCACHPCMQTAAGADTLLQTAAGASAVDYARIDYTTDLARRAA